jgi:hypothetical protein
MVTRRNTATKKQKVALPFTLFWSVKYIQQTLANPVTDNPDKNMENEKFCSQLSTCFKRHMGFGKADESL